MPSGSSGIAEAGERDRVRPAVKITGSLPRSQLPVYKPMEREFVAASS